MVQPNRSTVRYPGYDQFSQLKVDSAPSSAGKGNCFSQLGANALEPGSIPSECWRSIPAWMRCSMVVVSTGPGGSGVAFHKHGTAWLALQQGRKRWWLYPPQGPPKEAVTRSDFTFVTQASA